MSDYYKILKADSAEALTRLVNQACSEGWLPCGSVVKSGGLWLQSMVKD